MQPTQCRQLTTRDEVTKALWCWAGCRPRVVLTAAQHVRRLKCALEQIVTVRLYSVSVLLLYDAAKAGESTSETDVFLVDFAHSFHAPQAPRGRDDNVVAALESLNQVLSELAAEGG